MDVPGFLGVLIKRVDNNK